MIKNERFRKVYNEFGTVIFQYAMKRVRNEDVAKEFVQQVFMKFYEHMDEVKLNVEKPWLLLCCKHEIIDYFRKPENRNRCDSIDPASVTVEVRSEGNIECVVENMLREDLSMQILEALRKKNESWYRIVEEIAVLEMSQEEAAEHLGMSLEVLRAKLYRARKYIRKKFGEEYLQL